MLRYRLDELGWRQFEELIQLLLKQDLSVAVQAWGGHRDNGRDAFYRGRLRFPDKEILSEGPFLFQVKFVEEANAAGAQPTAALISAVRKEAERIEERLRARDRLSADWKAIRHYVLYTNVALLPGLRSQIEQVLAVVLPDCAIHTMGGHDVCNLIDSHPTAKRAFPQLLSLRDFDVLLEEAVNKDVLERSRSAVEEARDLLPVFVPTRAYSEAFKVVRRHYFVVLEGPPEMGKTAIARILGLVQLFAAWDMIECRNPDDFFKLYNNERSQVFIADDAFGHTEYEPDRVRAWEHDLPKIIGRLDRRHWLLWTSRRHILERARRSMDLQGKAENFPQPAEVVVDASELSTSEKALILYRHARAARLDSKIKALVRENAVRVVRQGAFTPERIRRFVKDDVRTLSSIQPDDPERTFLLHRLVDDAIQNPTRRMRSSYEALTGPQKWLLISLLEGGYGCGKEKLRNLYEKHAGKIAGEPFERLVEELSEGFLRIHHQEQREILGMQIEAYDWVSWIHPSYRDLVIEELSNDPTLKGHFLGNTNLEGIKLALSDAGGAAGGRKFPLIRSDDDWKTLVTRCPQFAANAEEPEAAEMLQVLYSAHEVASTEKAGRLTEIISAVCDVLREKWDNDGQPALKSLKAYCQASGVCDRLPALPNFTKIWEDFLSRLEDEVDPTSSRLFLNPEVLDEWIELIDLLTENEPRFLRHLGFPERIPGVIAKLFECIQRELREDVEETMLSEVATNTRKLADKTRRLSALAGHEPGAARALATQLLEYSGMLRERARKRDQEEGEPPDDDDYDRRDEESVDIEALFSDL
jgi:hypothetical protein